jgi:hypothetical protein
MGRCWGSNYGGVTSFVAILSLAQGRLENLPYGKLAACRYGLAISEKSFLFLRTWVFAACGRRAIMEVREMEDRG